MASSSESTSNEAKSIGSRTRDRNFMANDSMLSPLAISPESNSFIEFKAFANSKDHRQSSFDQRKQLAYSNSQRMIKNAQPTMHE